MEEADALADRIAVVVDGKLKCIGTPLNLKNTYGEGYIINMICDQNDQLEIIDLMNQIAPSNKLID
jgi:ABC-type proline/glycine betaine transport system ATPase subunit